MYPLKSWSRALYVATHFVNYVYVVQRHRVMPVHSGVSVIQLVSDLHQSVHSDYPTDSSGRITTDCLLTESLLSQITTLMLQLLMFVGNRSGIDVSKYGSMDDTQSKSIEHW